MSDSDDVLSPEARAHLERAKAVRTSVPSDARERVRQRLEATLGDAAWSKPGGNAALPAKAAVAGGGFLKGAMVGAALGVAAGASIEHARLENLQAPATMVHSAPDSGALPEVDASLVLDAAPPREHAPVAAAKIAEQARPSSVESPRERLMIETVRQAIVRGDAVAAHSAIQAHEQAFPHGELQEERDSLRIRALLLAGDANSARPMLRLFEQRYPQSLFTPALQRALRLQALGGP